MHLALAAGSILIDNAGRSRSGSEQAGSIDGKGTSRHGIMGFRTRIVVTVGALFFRGIR